MQAKLLAEHAKGERNNTPKGNQPKGKVDEPMPPSHDIIDLKTGKVIDPSAIDDYFFISLFDGTSSTLAIGPEIVDVILPAGTHRQVDLRGVVIVAGKSDTTSDSAGKSLRDRSTSRVGHCINN